MKKEILDHTEKNIATSDFKTLNAVLILQVIQQLLLMSNLKHDPSNLLYRTTLYTVKNFQTSTVEMKYRFLYYFHDKSQNV